jgi:hypothetical protein
MLVTPVRAAKYIFDLLTCCPIRLNSEKLNTAGLLKKSTIRRLLQLSTFIRLWRNQPATIN